MYSVGLTGEGEEPAQYLISNDESHRIIASCGVHQHKGLNEVVKKELLELVRFANLGLNKEKTG